MPVNVRGHLDIRVSHIFLHVLEGAAVIQQQRGAGVTKLVEADMRQTVLFEQQSEVRRHIVRRKWTTIRPLENIAVFVILLAKQAAVLAFRG